MKTEIKVIVKSNTKTGKITECFMNFYNSKSQPIFKQDISKYNLTKTLIALGMKCEEAIGNPDVTTQIYS